MDAWFRQELDFAGTVFDFALGFYKSEIEAGLPPDPRRPSRRRVLTCLTRICDLEQLASDLGDEEKRVAVDARKDALVRLDALEGPAKPSTAP